MSTDFTTIIQNFQSISPQEARELLEKKDGAILFIGRPTCPYCVRFAPKLAEAAARNQWTVYFLHSQSPAYSAQEIVALRDDYQVPTVPGLLHAKKEGIAVRCDSSMTVDEITDFINH